MSSLFERLGIENDPEAQTQVTSQAWSFFKQLQMMTEDEREVVLSILHRGCDIELPNNIHYDVDLLHRITGKAAFELRELLGQIRSLGFTCTLRKDWDPENHPGGELLGESYQFCLSWADLTRNEEVIPATVVAREMIVGAVEGYCTEHGQEFIQRLDFSRLAGAPVSNESGKDDGN